MLNLVMAGNNLKSRHRTPTRHSCCRGKPAAQIVAAQILDDLLRFEMVFKRVFAKCLPKPFILSLSKDDMGLDYLPPAQPSVLRQAQDERLGFVNTL